MSRKARQKSSTNTYHVVIKGADRQLLFEDVKDYKKYLEILEYYKQECGFELYAYCLMSNHVHLLIHTTGCSLESVFRHINTSYAMWFNMKYQRTGFLQQGRYYSEPVEDARYLFTVIQYIHQNPYRAGLEKTVGTSYPWSSFHDYKIQYSTLLNLDPVFHLLGSRKEFLAMHDNVTDVPCLDIDNFKKRLPDDVAKDIIYQECHCSTVSEFQQLSLSERNLSIRSLHEKGLSIRQLNRLTGTSRGVIERIVTKHR